MGGRSLAFFGPTVQAIREASPDRCIIVDVHCGGLKGEKIAEMGAALSYHCYDPREFCCLSPENQDDSAYLQTVAWPFTTHDGILYDAKAVLDSRIDHSVSANELARIAKEHGVGFMIGEWGIFGDGLTRNRYPDETVSAYFLDMGNEMKEKGYGWCYGNYHYPYCFTCCAPAVKNAEYEQIGNHEFYIDIRMRNLFAQIMAN